MTQDNTEKHDKIEPVVVRLDETAISEAKSILFQAYRHDPTFQYLFNSKRSGYDQRVRATIRELTNLYLELDQDAVGIMVKNTLVGAAFIGDPALRLDLANQFSWRVRMVLTAGFASTRRYLDYHKQIRAMLPDASAHQLPLMGVHPKYQNRGLGRLLLQTVEQLCADSPRGSGLVLDTGNSRYLHFYESMGFRSLGKIQLGDQEDHILFRELAPATDKAETS
ncbi:MAG: GNAT family N-acetyltransferase [Oleiphilaceae bacterium]|nr:GNAT family N-acetyltransferase [Oleiphilaceae bacterium]